jgi:hypothetical protein
MLILILGGGVKLGKSGERGAAAPDPATPVAEQDRGYLVQDNHFYNTTQEYSSANPIFIGYVADTILTHNTIHNSKYSGICAGWGWGLTSYTRNIQIQNNSISKIMQLLSDGGGVYTNTPCNGCSVSRNYFESDPHVYGCLCKRCLHNAFCYCRGLCCDGLMLSWQITMVVLGSGPTKTTCLITSERLLCSVMAPALVSPSARSTTTTRVLPTCRGRPTASCTT